MLPPPDSTPIPKLYADEPEKQAKLYKFLEQNWARCEQWDKAHQQYKINIVNGEKRVELGKCLAPLPIAWDNSRQEFFWMNRAYRRAM